MVELASYEILVDQQSISAASIDSVLSIDILLNLNEASSLEINLKSNFENKLDQVFAIGKSIQVLLGYDGVNKSVFMGTITGQGIESEEEASSFIVISDAQMNFSQSSPTPALTLTYGENIFEFNASLRTDGAAESEGNLQGYVQSQGNAVVVPGDCIEIGGFYQAFNGLNRIQSIHHRVSTGRWMCSYEMGGEGS